MGLRIATKDDLDTVLDLCYKFADASPYLNFVSKDKLKDQIVDFLNQKRSEKIILLYDDVGILVAMKSEFIFGNESVATEIGWWVEPEHRKSNIGKELMAAFEFWAKTVGCKAVVMTELNETEHLRKFYEKSGFKIYERSYFKEI